MVYIVAASCSEKVSEALLYKQGPVRVEVYILIIKKMF